jgi:serine phosphatase RsbU (regulator of sigma subunit)
VRDFVFSSVRARLIAYILGLVLLVEVMTFALLFNENSENLRQKVQSDLVAGAHLFYTQVNQQFGRLLKVSKSVSDQKLPPLSALGRATGADLVLLADLSARTVDSDRGDARGLLYEIETSIRRTPQGAATGFLAFNDRMYQIAFARVPAQARARVRVRARAQPHEKWLGLGRELSRGSAVSVDGITRLRVSFLSYLPGLERTLMAQDLSDSDKSNLKQALGGFKQDAIKFIDMGSVDHLTLAVPLRMQVDHRVFAVFYYSIDHTTTPLRTFQRVLLVILGAGILLSCLMALRLSRHFLRPLQALSSGTNSFRGGDLAYRIPNLGHDEFGDLGRSFNVMGERIQSLLIETEQKARMETELNMARLVQQRLFPGKGFQDPQIALAGTILPASECGGDWWFYRQIGRTLIVAICDVAGHGASAALMTAAVHSCFSLLIDQIDPSIPLSADRLGGILRQLNSAAHSAAGETSPITFFLSAIDLDTGVMQFCNAAHCFPLVLRDSGVVPLIGGRATLLGWQPDFKAAVHTAQLQGGDLILWYSDGLFETFPRKAALAFLNELTHSGTSDVNTLCNKFTHELKSKAETAGIQEDDVTFVIGLVPTEGSWGKSSKSEEREILLRKLG